MKPLHVVLIAVVAVGVGAAGGFIAGGQMDGPPPHRPAIAAPEESEVTPKADPNRDTRQAARTDSTDSASAKVAPRVEMPEPVRSEPASQAFATWMRQFADELPIPGEGRITGHVRLKDGTPLQGATIKAKPRKATQPPWDADAPLEDYLERVARTQHFSRKGESSAVTNAEGAYEIGSLGDYQFTVSAEAEGYQCNAVNPQLAYRVLPGAEMDFEAVPVCKVIMDIRMPDGSQPEAVSAKAYTSTHNYSTLKWSREKPDASIQPGKYELRVTSGDKEEYASDPVALDISDGDPPLELKINLRIQPGITCQLKYPAGMDQSAGMYRGYNDTRIHLVADPPSDPPADSGYGYDGQGLWSGAAKFPGLKPGRYRLIAASTGKLVAWKDVTLTDEPVDVTLEVPEPKAEEYFVLRIYGPEGELVRDAQIYHYANVNRGQFYGNSGSVLRRPDGSYWLLKSEGGGSDKEWHYQVTIQTPKYGKTVVKHPGNATNDLEVRMEKPAYVTVLMPGATTHPDKARIRPNLTLVQPGMSIGGIESASSGRSVSGLSEEKERFGPLAPGKYRFSYQLSTGDNAYYYNGGGSSIAQWDFEVAAGADITQTCPVPAIYKLTLLVEDTKKVSNMSLRRADGTATRTLYGGGVQERTVFEGLTAGEWIVSAGGGEMRVQITRDTEVALELKPHDCLRIYGLREGGAIERLGLRNGDLLIRVDQQEFEKIHDLRNQAQQSYSKDSTVWAVIRNGTELNVPLNGKAILDAQKGEDRETIRFSNATRD